MSKLDTSAELVKLSQLLGVPSTELDFLEGLPLPTLIKVRALTTNKLFNDGRKLFQKLASASKLLPSGITATIGEKIFGAMLCARIASEMPYQRAVELADKMTIPFLAKVTLEIDPRRVKDIIQNMPIAKLRAVATELLTQKHYVIMGGFVGYMLPAQLKVILQDVSTEEALLHIGFFIEGKHQLSEIIRLLPKERLHKLIGYLQLHEELWPEALALMIHLEDELKRELGDIAAELGDTLLDDLVNTVQRLDLWQDALPLFACMSPATQFKLINTPLLSEVMPLTSVLVNTDRFSLWATLLPLIEYMSITQRQMLTNLVIEQSTDFQERMITAVAHHQLWRPAFDVLVLMPESAQQHFVGQFKQLLAAKPELSTTWKPLVEERQLGHLFN
ncbi:MAG: hypothetical protein KGO49_13845 [Gammaproteobacteria bacterium]|nr:hypothetical protein [Gammaproteobacteria bacterium]